MVGTVNFWSWLKDQYVNNSDTAENRDVWVDNALASWGKCTTLNLSLKRLLEQLHTIWSSTEEKETFRLTAAACRIYSVDLDWQTLPQVGKNGKWLLCSLFMVEIAVAQTFVQI